MNPSCAGGDHAAIYLERCTTRWLAELVGYPGDGVLVSGGADGALTALAAARHRAAIPGVVQSAGEVDLRGTVVHGSEALRACFMHDATTTDDVDHIVGAVLRAARGLASR